MWMAARISSRGTGISRRGPGRWNSLHRITGRTGGRNLKHEQRPHLAGGSMTWEGEPLGLADLGEQRSP